MSRITLKMTPKEQLRESLAKHLENAERNAFKNPNDTKAAETYTYLVSRLFPEAEADYTLMAALSEAPLNSPLAYKIAKRLENDSIIKLVKTTSPKDVSNYICKIILSPPIKFEP